MHFMSFLKSGWKVKQRHRDAVSLTFLARTIDMVEVQVEPICCLILKSALLHCTLDKSMTKLIKCPVFLPSRILARA